MANGRFKEITKYTTMEDLKRHNDNWKRADEDLTSLQTQITNHKASSAAHGADHITYSGRVAATNVKDAIDKQDQRIDNLAASAGDSNTEIVDMRYSSPFDETFPVAGDRVAALEVDVIQRGFNVKRYGARGDGITDDTGAVREAINAAKAAGGGIVYFPSGVYLIRSVIVPSNIKIIGNGAKIKAKDVFYTKVTNDVMANDTIFNVSDASDIKIGDVLTVFDSNADIVYVTAVAGNEISVSPIRMYRGINETYTGFKYSHASGANVMTLPQIFWVTKGVTIDADEIDSTPKVGGVENVSFEGIEFIGSKGSHDITKPNVYELTCSGAIMFYRTSNCNVKQCNFRDAFSTPVVYYGWNTSFDFVSNKCLDVGYVMSTSRPVAERDATSGIVLHWDQRYIGQSNIAEHVSDNFTIGFNKFERCWNGGPFISAANNGSIIGNNIDTFVSHGLSIYGGDAGLPVFNITVSNNTIQNGRIGSDAAASGIGLWVSVARFGVSLTGNTVRNCEIGISVGSSSNVTISGNAILDCVYRYIEQLYTCQHILYTSNLLSHGSGKESNPSGHIIYLDSTGGSSDNANIRFLGNNYQISSSYQGSVVVMIAKCNDVVFSSEKPRAVKNWCSITDTTSTIKPKFVDYDFTGVPATGLSASNSTRIMCIDTNQKTVIAGLGGTLEYNFREMAVISFGTTASRPTVSTIGYPYFDTTLGKPIWWNGTNWKDATGATV